MGWWWSTLSLRTVVYTLPRGDMAFCIICRRYIATGLDYFGRLSLYMERIKIGKNRTACSSRLAIFLSFFEAYYIIIHDSMI